MDLLKNLAQQLGVDERQARVVAGTIVEAARQAAPQRVRNDVRRAVPEASSWVLEAASHQSHRSASQRLASGDIDVLQRLASAQSSLPPSRQSARIGQAARIVQPSP